MTARLVWLEGQYVFEGQKSIKLHDYKRSGCQLQLLAVIDTTLNNLESEGFVDPLGGLIGELGV
jgi:hypothetical protein